MLATVRHPFAPIHVIISNPPIPKGFKVEVLPGPGESRYGKLLTDAIWSDIPSYTPASTWLDWVDGEETWMGTSYYA